MGSSAKKKRSQAIRDAFQQLPLEKREELLEIARSELKKRPERVDETGPVAPNLLSPIPSQETKAITPPPTPIHFTLESPPPMETLTVHKQDQTEETKPAPKLDGSTPGERSWSDLFKNRTEGMKYYKPEEVAGRMMGKIPMACVQASAQRWEHTIICQVLGSHPPLHVMDGFFRRVWKASHIVKVWPLSPGVFMVKFEDALTCKEIIDRGLLMFENKPVLVHPWTKNFKNTIPSKVPVWVQLRGLNPLYWTPEILSRILSPVGKPLMVDTATQTQDRLAFARLQMEMEITKELPSQFEYLDENDIVQQQVIEFEWKPVLCSHCNMLGHSSQECKKMKPSINLANPKAKPVKMYRIKKQELDAPSGEVKASQARQFPSQPKETDQEPSPAHMPSTSLQGGTLGRPPSPPQ